MKKSLLTATVGLSLLTACSGSMNAVSSSGDAVQFKFTQGVASDTYTAVVGDESFKGRAVMVDAKTTFGTAFGTALFGILIDNTFSIEQIALVSGSYILIAILLLFLVKNKLNPDYL